MKPALDDDEVRGLLARVARRDESALEALHRAYARRVHAFVLHRCSDDAIADSVVGDTFYEVWKRPEAFRGESAFSTWLLGVARFKMLDALRGRGPAHDDVDEVADVIACEAPTGEQRLMQSQQTGLMQRCLKTLSRMHRECLHLVYFEELPVIQVASLQGVPEGTVKTRLFHARAQMRRCLEQTSEVAV